MMIKNEQLNQEVETGWIAYTQCKCNDQPFFDQFLLYAGIVGKKSGNAQSLKSISNKFPDIPAFLSKYIE